MSDARKAAEARYPYDYAREGDRLTSQQAFIEGAEWQAARTPQITEMQEAIRFALENTRGNSLISDLPRVRARLEAALGQTNDAKEETV